MSSTERRAWYVIALPAVALALYLGIKYPELHDDLPWSPPGIPLGR